MAAQNGTFVFQAIDDNATFRVDTYIPDAVATNLTFNNVGLSASTSTTYWTAPEDCWLIDVVGTAPTAVGATITYNGAPVPNQTFRWACQLTTLATRAPLRFYVPKGTQVGALQF
jgi:hypothetical protein